ncbi:MAG TPA: 4Fe-4S dicluster domain-containing protein [Candidatus Cloacimonadota bacterium]|nr:4Fe-4S dicluster domain-containing protein [Candidatus Cloacimonadota bacterium]HPT72401.1 4Fe-4S dicluster domain-containing protein [Candidatus Cloacimonadota bacterium]
MFRCLPGCLFVSDKERHIREYNWLVDEENRAGKCVNCGACVPKCPQQINIPVELAKVKEFLGS